MTELTDRNHRPSEIIARLGRFRWVAGKIEAGLQGSPFHWNMGEGDYCVEWAKMMGINLVTKTQITKLGYRLKKGVYPVGSRYFGAPISKSAMLYVLECQAVKVEEKNA